MVFQDLWDKVLFYGLVPLCPCIDTYVYKIFVSSEFYRRLADTYADTVVETGDELRGMRKFSWLDKGRKYVGQIT
jgi:hypothetical protein